MNKLNLLLIPLLLSIFSYTGFASGNDIDDKSRSVFAMKLNTKEDESFGKYNTLNNNNVTVINNGLRKYSGKDAEINSSTDIRKKYSNGIIKKDFKDIEEGDILFLDKLGTVTLYMGKSYGYLGNFDNKDTITYSKDKYNLIKDWYSGEVIPIDYIKDMSKKTIDIGDDVIELNTTFKLSGNKKDDLRKVKNYVGKEIIDNYDLSEDEQTYKNYVKSDKELSKKDGYYINYIPNSVLSNELKHYVKEELKGKNITVFNFGDVESAYLGAKFYSDLTGKEMFEDFSYVYKIEDGKVIDLSSSISEHEHGGLGDEN